MGLPPVFYVVHSSEAETHGKTETNLLHLHLITTLLKAYLQQLILAGGKKMHTRFLTMQMEWCSALALLNRKNKEATWWAAGKTL